MLEIREYVSPGSHVFTDSRYHSTPLFFRITRLAKSVIDKRARHNVRRGAFFRLRHATTPRDFNAFPGLIGRTMNHDGIRRPPAEERGNGCQKISNSAHRPSGSAAIEKRPDQVFPHSAKRCNRRQKTRQKLFRCL